MKIDDLIIELESFNEKYGNVLVRYYDEIEEKDMKIDNLMPVNIHTADLPVWCCMLSD